MGLLEREVINCCYRGEPSNPFAIYANNRMVALRTALEKNFPTLVHYSGRENLRSLLREFCQRFPPSSPYLVFYGNQLAEFLREKRLFTEADIAELDYAWLSALMAKDVDVVAPGEVDRPEQLEHLRLNPAFFVSACQHEHLSLWMSIAQNHACVEENDNSRPIDVLFYRDEYLRVRVRILNDPESLFLECLFQGLTIEQAAERLAGEYPEFSLSDWFGQLLVMGAFYYE